MRPLAAETHSALSSRILKGYLGINFLSVLPPEDWSAHIRNEMAGSMVDRFTANHPVAVVI